MTAGATTWNYTYNADGLRTQRTDDEDTYDYVYLDGQLVKLTVNDSGNEIVMYFAYDADGTPLSVNYQGSTYYYATNLQGDVVAIVNQSGNTLVSYTYDAWGNPTTPTGSSANTLGKYNPLRYRGYVYDTETGLYYLQSRYYDPEMGRFINVDALVSTGQGVLGNNMFMYCLNSPTNMTDPLGTYPICEIYHSQMSTIDAPSAIINKNSSTKLKKIGESLIYNLEFSAGFGLGIYAETTVLEVVGLAGGIYGNNLSICLEDGEFSVGSEYNTGVSASLFGHNYGFTEYAFYKDFIPSELEVNKGFYNDETYTIFSIAAYPGIGGSIRIGFDTINFCADLDEILERRM